MFLSVIDNLTFRVLAGYLVEANLEPVDGSNLCILLRLFQSQPQTGSASAETLENDMQGFARIVIQDRCKLFLGLVCNRHCLPFLSRT